MATKPKAEPCSDKTKTVARALWKEFAWMEPSGEARIRRHLKELEQLLTLVDQKYIESVVKALKPDKWRRGWVASVESIAENLPRIRLYLDHQPMKKKSFVQRWREGNE